MKISSYIIRIMSFSVVLLFVESAFSYDYLSFISKKCELNSGFLIDTNETEAVILGKDGKLKFISRNSIQGILVYKVNANLLNKIELGSDLKKYLKNISISNSRRKLKSFI